MPSKEARYADALAEDLYTKSKTDLPEGTDYAIVKGPTGTRIPIPRNGEDDESWHERIKNWQDRGVLVDWKGPAAEKMRTPEAKVVAVEDAQPDGELAFRQANKKLIDERQASEIADARGAGIKSQAEALKQKGIPYIFNDEGLFIPRGQNMTDEQWQAAKDAAAKKFTSISVWDGPDKEPDSDADERVASGSGGSKFDQLRKAMSSLFTNAVPEGASSSFSKGYQDAQSVGQNYTPADAKQSVEPPKRTNAEVSKEHGEQVGSALLDSARSIINPAAGAMNTLAIPEVSKALQYGVAGTAAATSPVPGLQAAGHLLAPNLIPSPLAQQDATANALAAETTGAPGAMPQPRPGISEEVPGVVAAAPPRAMGIGAPTPAQDHFGKELDAQGEKYDRAARKAAEIEAAAQQRMADVRLDAQKEAMVQQAEMMDAQQRMVDREERAVQAYQQTVADMQAPAAIDPDHYWKVRDTSQKVASVLAAFFSGGSTLASMHAAINRDVAAQQTTAQNQMTFNKDKLAATYNTYLMGRQNGLDAIQAKAVATDVAYSNAENLVKTIAMQSGSEAVKQKAEMALAEMGEARVKAKQSFEMATRAANAHDEANRIDRFKANLMAQRAAGAGAGGGKALSGIIQARLDNALNGIAQVDAALKELGPEQSFGDAAVDEAAKRVPVVATDAKARQRAYEVATRRLKVLYDQSALQKHDNEFWDGLLGGVGLGNRKGSHKALNVMRQQFINEYNNTLRGAAVEAPRPQPTSFATAEEE